MKWRGMAVEFMQATSHDRIEYSFRSPVHLLAAYQHGTRRDGESYVQGLPRSTLRDMTKKLIFVPASHEYREWHDPRTLPGITYFCFNPAELQAELKPTRPISRLRRGCSLKTQRSGTLRQNLSRQSMRAMEQISSMSKPSA